MMKTELKIYLLMGYDPILDHTYSVRGFYSEDKAKQYKEEMKIKEPDDHFYWKEIEVE
ncbi:TPA: hypothetical protein ACS70V_003699 [Providencia alcalifaciens]|uniref:hypothetical protein n=1 Tax=Providencia alcalifaciens TaxID=126385 RepID=UPI001CC39E67